MAFVIDDIIRDVLEDNAAARRAFMAKHGTHAQRIAKKLGAFYLEFQHDIRDWESTERNKVVGQFLHAAGNSLVQSTNLLVASMFAPSGNMMRQYAESLAMTLLCVSPGTKTLEAYLANRADYPVHKAIDRLNNSKVSRALVKDLGFDPAGWSRFREAVSFFDRHSHASVITLGSNQLLGSNAGAIVIGAEYDPLKFSIYRKELRYRLGAAGNLMDVLKRLNDMVPKR